MSIYPLRKAVILAGGLGKRLAPITSAISKQLLPIYDKPMIYYPLCTVMLCGIKDIMIIVTPENESLFKSLLGSGKDWGVEFSYKVQERPEGVAQSLLIAEDFIGENSVLLALGDNLFHGNELIDLLSSANKRQIGSTIFAYPVKDPEKYGVVEFDEFGNAKHIEEKPESPKSQYVVPGLYFYDNSVIERVKKLTFSQRGELEITSLNKGYLDDGMLNVEIMGRGMTWLDMGTFDSLHEASAYIQTLESRQGLKIGCPEEVAWRKRWIGDSQLVKLSQPLIQSGYGEYLLQLLEKPRIDK